MSFIDIIGFSAAFCTTSAFLPQALKVLKTGDTKSLSLAMYIIFTTGVGLWLAYALFIQDMAMITANAITFVFAFAILVTIIKNTVKAKQVKTE
ncbi:SemiSWEET transporter [Catenovulum sp. 2E275]|uniref:SemiSWEET transporter n=1 Tax=Catenovulum sp. 2E275 TaxID=2980497 RepID=UPI0021CE8D83|nr:SemiSWEET transporter [Catenovulum sp. 2E275]MCU4674342.1 SemiSWEET transporter [Catenovulum sp. 2E275]